MKLSALLNQKESHTIGQPEKTTSQKIKVRACSIRNKDNPEWGTWGVMEDRGSYFEIFNHGWRVLFKSEADEHWEVVEK
jgi:hypothetical protein